MQRIVTLLLPFPVSIYIGFGVFRFGTTGPSDIDAYRLLGLITAVLIIDILAWRAFPIAFKSHSPFLKLVWISLLILVSSVILSGPIISFIELIGHKFDFEPTPMWVWPTFGVLCLVPLLPFVLILHLFGYLVDFIISKYRANKALQPTPSS